MTNYAELDEAEDFFFTLTFSELKRQTKLP